MHISAPRKSINLLAYDGFEHTHLGKIINWLLSAGRIIVIFTELIVILAFLSRFWLDKTLNDLNEDNSSRKVQIDASAEFENEFRDTQTRLNEYVRMDKQIIRPADIFKKTSKLLPQDIIFTKLSVNEKEILIDGISVSEAGVAGFIKALKTSKDFKNTALTDLSLATSGQQVFNFSIKTEIAENSNQKETSQNGN